MPTFRHGALHVIEEAHDKDTIQRLIKKIDDRLFVEKQVTLAGEEVWCVVCDVGSEVPPITFIEWRDELGRPIPYLAERLVQRVQQMDRDAGRLYSKVIAANAAMIETQRQAAMSQYEAIMDDMLPRMGPGHSAVLPRGQWLRQSRDRRRSRGEKV